MSGKESCLHFVQLGSNGCSCSDQTEVVKTKDGKNVDKWHTFGPKCPEDTPEKRLIKIVKEKLQRKEIPITIGWTGYIDLLMPMSEYPNSWCLDETSRPVFIYNNKLYFQRYENGGPLMQGPLSRGIFNDMTSEDEINSLMLALSK